MTTKVYSILNANQIVVNKIVVDDPMPPNYWPGYGKYIICDEPPCNTSGGCQLTVLTVVPNRTPQIGDFLNIANGAVIRYVPNLVIQDGQTVSSAPVVRLVDER